MPSLSQSTAPAWRTSAPPWTTAERLADYTVNFVSIRQDADWTQMLSALPGGQCPCPHWGFLLKGQMTVRYTNGEETIGAGEAFYLPPGHVPAAEAGTDFVAVQPRC